MCNSVCHLRLEYTGVRVEKAGQWQVALQLFDSMQSGNLSPDIISHSAAISSCEKGREALALTPPPNYRYFDFLDPNPQP